MSDRPSTRDGEFLTRAILLATDSVADRGGPFGAVIVGPDGQVVATGVNRVTASADPTAHAQVNAIRAACAIRRGVSLAGCTLYASCEPFPLCLAQQPFEAWASHAGRVEY
jgi:guanine deaminase